MYPTYVAVRGHHGIFVLELIHICAGTPECWVISQIRIITSLEASTDGLRAEAWVTGPGPLPSPHAPRFCGFLPW